jgi:hypothetical protein
MLEEKPQFQTGHNMFELQKSSIHENKTQRIVPAPYVLDILDIYGSAIVSLFLSISISLTSNNSLSNVIIRSIEFKTKFANIKESLPPNL